MTYRHLESLLVKYESVSTLFVTPLTVKIFRSIICPYKHNTKRNLILWLKYYAQPFYYGAKNANLILKEHVCSPKWLNWGECQLTILNCKLRFVAKIQPIFESLFGDVTTIIVTNDIHVFLNICNSKREEKQFSPVHQHVHDLQMRCTVELPESGN